MLDVVVVGIIIVVVVVVVVGMVHMLCSHLIGMTSR